MNTADTDRTSPIPSLERPRRSGPPWAVLAAVTVAVGLLAGMVLAMCIKDNPVTSEDLTAAQTTVPTTPVTSEPAPTTTAAPVAPRTTAAPAATTTTTVAPDRLSRQSRVSLDGIGPVDIGMTLAQARAAAGIPLQYDPDEFDSDCDHASVRDWSRRDLGLMIVGGRVVRVDVGGDSLIKTVSGIGTGSTEAEVLKTYAGRIRVDPHPYSPGGHNLVYVPQDPALRHLSMIFESIDGKVVAFRAGQAEQVAWIEGCA